MVVIKDGEEHSATKTHKCIRMYMHTHAHMYTLPTHTQTHTCSTSHTLANTILVHKHTCSKVRCWKRCVLRMVNTKNHNDETANHRHLVSIQYTTTMCKKSISHAFCTVSVPYFPHTSCCDLRRLWKFPDLSTNVKSRYFWNTKQYVFFCSIDLCAMCIVSF